MAKEMTPLKQEFFRRKEDIVRKIAFRIYQERIRKDDRGDEESDWEEAEEEYKVAFERL